MSNHYRQWHAPMEWCQRCNQHRAINGDLSCPEGHRIKGLAPQFRAVSGCLLRGPLVVYQNPVTHAQAANFLREWNSEESWRTIARRLLGYPANGLIASAKVAEVGRVAALLNAHAARKMESDEVMFLLDVEPPKVYTLAFRFRDRDRFERVRAAVDEHEEGRTAWLVEQVGE